MKSFEMLVMVAKIVEIVQRSNQILYKLCTFIENDCQKSLYIQNKFHLRLLLSALYKRRTDKIEKYYLLLKFIRFEVFSWEFLLSLLLKSQVIASE